jgi:hypothetical protein
MHNHTHTYTHTEEEEEEEEEGLVLCQNRTVDSEEKGKVQ